jgi:DNA repair photolyase
MTVNEIKSKTILSVSKIYDYVINPYIGCQHGCSYCYARFMKRFSGHLEPWGLFADVKINAPELLRKEITKKKRGRVWMSGLCDPYQPLEVKYELTRQCLEILAANGWPVTIQTRSPLVLRDLDILKGARDLEAGLSITTADDKIRRLFEPYATSVEDRLDTLEELHLNGIRTYAMIAPVLPGAEALAEALVGKVDHIILDRMNYHYADWIYRKNKIDNTLSDEYFRKVSTMITDVCKKSGITCEVVY